MITKSSLLVAVRVFRQLRRDPRTMFLFIASPTFVLILLKGMMGHEPASFDHYALVVTGMFPTAPAFLFTAFAINRDRNARTLEHLLTTPVHKIDVIVGYAIAFMLPALAQVALMVSVTYGLLGLHVAGQPWEVALLALMACVLGIAIGVMSANFARNEFQLTKLIAMIAIPQLMLSGFFRPPSRMVGWMGFLSHFVPWRYGVSLLKTFQYHSVLTGSGWFNLGVMVGIVLLLFSVSAFTVLSRRTA